MQRARIISENCLQSNKRLQLTCVKVITTWGDEKHETGKKNEEKLTLFTTTEDANEAVCSADGEKKSQF